MTAGRPLVVLTALLFAGAPIQAQVDQHWREWKVIWRDHTDIAADYDPAEDAWTLTVDRGDFEDPTDAALDPLETILLVPHHTRREVPPDIPPNFSFLGEEGDSYYRLPFGVEENVLDLGFNAERFSSDFDHFADDRVHFELVDFRGKDDFVLYRGSEPTIFMDTRAENPPFGERSEPLGGHSHHTWFFRERGIYILFLETYAELAADGSITRSEEPVPLYFLVDPEPVHWWRLDTFRTEAKEPHAALTADAGGDGRPNLLAYALDYSPFEPADRYLPFPEIVERDESRHLSLVFRAPEGSAGLDDRSDLIYRVQVSTDLETWEDLENDGLESLEQVAPDADGTRRFRAVDPIPLGVSEHRFIRLEVEMVE